MKTIIALIALLALTGCFEDTKREEANKLAREFMGGPPKCDDCTLKKSFFAPPEK
jgi:hypothetical protein